MFASEHEAVFPDIMVLGKGLTCWYLPLPITVISEKLFSAFDASVGDGKALAYGHSYTGNARDCAAAKASLEVFENEGVLEVLKPKIQRLSSALAHLKELPGLKGGAPVRIDCWNRDRARRDGRSRLPRSAALWPPDETDLKCSRSNAAPVYHNGSVRQSCGNSSCGDRRGLAL
jgi:aminotransferase class III